MSDTKSPDTCRTCTFYDGDERSGQCRRYPPTSLFRVFTQLEGWAKSEVVAVLPHVHVTEWCGEWKAER